MEVYKLNEGGHDWEKKNLVTQRNRKGLYDIYECRGCGVVGKSYADNSKRIRITCWWCCQFMDRIRN